MWQTREEAEGVGGVGEVEQAGEYRVMAQMGCDGLDPVVQGLEAWGDGTEQEKAEVAIVGRRGTLMSANCSAQSRSAWRL